MNASTIKDLYNKLCLTILSKTQEFLGKRTLNLVLKIKVYQKHALSSTGGAFYKQHECLLHQPININYRSFGWNLTKFANM